MINTVIVAGGKFPKDDIFNEVAKNADYIIAADSGYDYLIKQNVKVNYLIGDFDSIEYDITKVKTPDIIQFPKEKDFTDLHIAINKAIEIGSNKVTILGATGTRLDHTITNIFLLKILFDSGINGKIIDDNNEVMLVNGKVEILKTHYKYLSVIPLSDNTEVNISGVKYPLKNKRVSFNDSLCISNEINEKTATVEVSSFSLVIQSNDWELIIIWMDL